MMYVRFPCNNPMFSNAYAHICTYSSKIKENLISVTWSFLRLASRTATHFIRKEVTLIF